MRRFVMTVQLALVVCAAVGLSTPAARADDPVPPNWVGRLTGVTWPDGGVHRDAFGGTASHVGRFTGEGYHVLDPVTFTFVGEATWTAADGSTLAVAFTGFVFPTGDLDYPFGAVMDLAVVGGTGRLAGASGSAVLTGAFTGVPGELYFGIAGTLHPQGK